MFGLQISSCHHWAGSVDEKEVERVCVGKETCELLGSELDCSSDSVEWPQAFSSLQFYRVG